MLVLIALVVVVVVELYWCLPRSETRMQHAYTPPCFLGLLRKICPKIEKPQALTNIEGIIEKSQALMVARLGTEVERSMLWNLLQ